MAITILLTKTYILMVGCFNKRQVSSTSLKIYLCSGGKRLFKEIIQFEASPRLKKKFPNYPSDKARVDLFISYEEIAPSLTGRDFSLNLVASSDNSEYHLENICFIEDNDTSKPIFIVGLGRSGTSILTRSINKALDINHYGESHVLPVLPKIFLAVEDYFTKSSAAKLVGTIINDLDHYTLIAKIQQVIKQQYQDFFEAQYFVDKTADMPMLETIPYIKQTWPQAKFIFAKRRGIENVASRLQKFPHLSFEQHCQMWKDILIYWQSLRKDMSEWQYIEVDQYDIQNQPASVAQVIAGFLELAPQQGQVLEQTFLQEHPQLTRGNVREKAKSIVEIGWTTEQIEYFNSTCGNTMRAFGYSGK